MYIYIYKLKKIFLSTYYISVGWSSKIKQSCLHHIIRRFVVFIEANFTSDTRGFPWHGRGESGNDPGGCFNGWVGLIPWDTQFHKIQENVTLHPLHDKTSSRCNICNTTKNIAGEKMGQVWYTPGKPLSIKRTGTILNNQARTTGRIGSKLSSMKKGWFWFDICSDTWV